MPWAKLPRVIRDYGLGYQTVNQAAENEQVLRDAFDAEHQFEAGILPRGRHDLARVPRAIVTVRFSPPAFPGAAPLQWVELSSSPPIHFPATALTRLGPGAYLLGLANIEPDAAWVEVQPAGGAGQVRLANSRITDPAGGAPVLGVFVRLLELHVASGAFQPADYDFTLTLFSR